MSVIVRPARPEDGPEIWRWRNDPVARAASLDPAPIPLERHLEWYAGALADPDRQILIGTAPDPVGMVRLDRGAETVTVSIALAQEARGRGLSVPLLRAGLAACRFAPARVRAVIRPGNAASLALFSKLGFDGPRDTDPIVLTREVP